MIANPIPWPDGARCAVAMTWDMDADSAFNWYNQDTADNLVAAQSWTRYDPLIAIPRLVEQFKRRELRLTFFVPGWALLVRARLRGLSQPCRQAAARLARAELCVLEILAEMRR